MKLIDRKTLSRLIEMNDNSLGHVLSELTPAEWRAIVAAVASERCLACGHSDGCACSEKVDDAKELVGGRAQELAVADFENGDY